MCTLFSATMTFLSDVCIPVWFFWSTLRSQVVTLMMDMKRLALRREAVASLEQRDADRAGELPEKIKLRSR